MVNLAANFQSYDGLKSQHTEIMWAIFAFFGKTTPYCKIFKILFRKFTWRHQLTWSCWNVLKFIRREIGKMVRFSLKLSLLHGSCQKSARASPNLLAHSDPDFIQIGSLPFSFLTSEIMWQLMDLCSTGIASLEWPISSVLRSNLQQVWLLAWPRWKMRA